MAGVYSFHFDNDVMRVQQIRQMGMIDGNGATLLPLSKRRPNDSKGRSPDAYLRSIPSLGIFYSHFAKTPG